MQRITKAQLNAKIDWLNETLGRPLKPYEMIDGKLVAQIGNFHLGQAYGGTQIQEMVNDGGGIRTHSGYETKREIAAIIDSMLSGVELARL